MPSLEWRLWLYGLYISHPSDPVPKIARASRRLKQSNRGPQVVVVFWRVLASVSLLLLHIGPRNAISYIEMSVTNRSYSYRLKTKDYSLGTRTSAGAQQPDGSTTHRSSTRARRIATRHQGESESLTEPRSKRPMCSCEITTVDIVLTPPLDRKRISISQTPPHCLSFVASG